jgi:hypothetical protein
VLIRPSLPVRTFHGAAERGPVLGGRRSLPGLPLRGDHDGPHAHLVQGLVDALLAVAAVSGDGSGTAPGAGDDPFDGSSELRGVGGVALLQSVVEHDAVVIVDDLASAEPYAGWIVRSGQGCGRLAAAGACRLRRASRA